MNYPTSYVFIAGSAGLLPDLRAQFFDANSDNTGDEIDTGFTYIGAGEGVHWYQYAADIPNDHQGGVKIYNVNAPAVILKAAAINPTELEYTRHLPGIRAGVVGRSFANDPRLPTQIDYYAEDGVTIEFTHEITRTSTDVERTIA